MPYKETSMEQGTPEWLEWRQQGIGASDASVLVGLNKWKSLEQLWLEKRGEYETPDNKYMARGREKESEALECFMEEVEDYEYTPFVLTHSEFSRHRASLDGWNGEIAVEIKCPGKKDHSEACQARIPKHYYPQLQWQMHVTGTNSIYYYSYDGFEGVKLTVIKDQRLLDLMISRADEFWTLCIEEGKHPSKSLLWGHAV